MEATRDRGGGNNRHAMFPTAHAYDATVGEEVEIRRTFANAITPGGTQGIIVERSLRWKPKTKEELILNVDGSFREENRKVGGGAILRTRDGKWIAGCSQKFNAHNPREAELMALEMGLEWVRKMGINRLEIQCDNVDVVSAVCSGIGRGETECRILYNCKRMIGGDEERKLVDVFWSNKVLQKKAN
nr:Ribonuclease H protein [Ipomoea batatas]